MRRYLLPVFFGLLLSLVGCDMDAVDEPTSEAWTFSGLENHDVQELTIRSETLYAATDSGMYRAPIETGEGWSSAGLQEKQVIDLTWRADGAMLAAVRYENEAEGPVLYKRAASGDEWMPFDENYGSGSDASVRALAAIPSARDTLYARGARNVARSMDGGEQWESVQGTWNEAGYQAPLLYVSPHDSSVVFAGGETSIFQAYLDRSSDFGTTWQSATGLPNEGDNAVYSMIEHPSEPGRFLLGMEGHVLRSEDGGESWETLYEPPNYTYVFDFAARQSGSQTIIYAAGSENGTQAGRLTLHRTDDFGDTWDRITFTNGPKSAAIRSLELVESNGRDYLFLGTTMGVFVYLP